MSDHIEAQRQQHSATIHIRKEIDKYFNNHDDIFHNHSYGMSDLNQSQMEQFSSIDNQIQQIDDQTQLVDDAMNLYQMEEHEDNDNQIGGYQIQQIDNANQVGGYQIQQIDYDNQIQQIDIDDEQIGTSTITDEFDIKGCLVGYKAKTEEELYDLYRQHSNALGFSIKRTTSHYSQKDGKMVDRYFNCSCQGSHRYTNQKPHVPPAVEVNEIVHPSPIVPTSELKKNSSDRKKKSVNIRRTGCLALMRIKLLREEDLYIVDRHDIMHNHDMIRPKWNHLKRSERSISEAKGRIIEQMIDSGIRPIDGYHVMAAEAGGEEFLGHTKRDYQNFVQRLKMRKVEHGDSQLVIDKLWNKAHQEPNFYYKIKYDEESRLKHVFWRDGMMQQDFDLFGDVIIFDTTYRTNKYDLICAPIVGINHHWNTVMYGCAFLSDETTETFAWLLTEFKKSMNGKEPITIFTDQDAAMSSAIQQVFQGRTRHRLCLWHLYQNAASRYGDLKNNDDFKKEFSHCLRGCDDVFEFERCWQDMLVKYELENNSWFTRLYGLRDKWCTGLSKDFFSTGILSSQRSESTNNAISFKASGNTSLSQFFDIFKETVKRWRSTEQQKEFDNITCRPQASLQCGLLKHAAEVYTIDIYKYFEEEVKAAFAAWFEIAVDIDKDNKVFHVTHENGYNNNPNKFKIVHFSRSSEGVSVECSCNHFNEVGWLCYHAIKVLNLSNVFKIPEKYILKRWMKSVKSSVWEREHNGHSDASNKAQEYVPWRQLMARKCYELVITCYENDGARRRLEDIFNKATIEIRQMLSNDLNENSATTEANSTGENSEILAPAIKDPIRASTKGKKRKATTKFQRKKPIGNEFGSKTPNFHLL